MKLIKRLSNISIHASRVGGDLCCHYFPLLSIHISIHASRVGGDS